MENKKISPVTEYYNQLDQIRDVEESRDRLISIGFYNEETKAIISSSMKMFKKLRDDALRSIGD